jgi:hypothetical protein
MATCRHVVNGALRKLGRLGGGREPRTADAADALAALQGLYLSWIASGAFGRLRDVIAEADIIAVEGCRIIRDEAVVTVTLPEVVQAYCNPLPYNLERDYYGTSPVDTSNRPPRDGSVVQIKDTVGGQVASHIYDGTLREWVQVEMLQMDNEAPRSVTDPEGLSAALAMELADTFGAEIGPTTLRQAGRFTAAMINNPSAPRREAAGVYM